MNENIYHMLNLLNVFLLVGVMSMNGKGRNAPLYLTKKLLAENVPKAAFDAKNLIVSNALPRLFVPQLGMLMGASSMPARYLRRMLRAKGFSKRQTRMLSRLVFPTYAVRKKLWENAVTDSNVGDILLGIQSRQQAICDLIAHHNHGGIRDQVLANIQEYEQKLSDLESELDSYEGEKSWYAFYDAHIEKETKKFKEMGHADRDASTQAKQQLQSLWRCTKVCGLLEDIAEVKRLLDMMHVEGMAYDIDKNLLEAGIGELPQCHMATGNSLWEEGRGPTTGGHTYFDLAWVTAQDWEPTEQAVTEALSNELLTAPEGILANIPVPTLSEFIAQEKQKWEDTVRELPIYGKVIEALEIEDKDAFTLIEVESEQVSGTNPLIMMHELTPSAQVDILRGYAEGQEDKELQESIMDLASSILDEF